MKKLVFDYEMKLTFSSPVTDHRFQLRCVPATGPRQQVVDVEVAIEPDVELETTIDSFDFRGHDRVHPAASHDIQLFGEGHRVRRQRPHQVGDL